MTADQESGGPKRVWAIVAFLVLLGAVPLIVNPVAPFEDWPSHLARVRILADMAAGEPFWRQFYGPPEYFLPDVALDVMVGGLHRAGLPIDRAGTVFLLFCYALFAGGVTLYARALGRRDPFRPLFASLLFINGSLVSGSINYVAGSGLAFGCAGLWIAARGTAWRYLTAIAGACAIFFFHIVAALLFVLFIGLSGLAAILAASGPFLGRLRLAHFSPAAALLTIAALMARVPEVNNLVPSAGRGEIMYAGDGLAQILSLKLRMLIHPLVDGAGVAGAAVLVGGLGLIFALALAGGRVSWRNQAGAAAGLVFLIALAAPRGIGVGYGLDYRFMPVFYVLVLIGATFDWRRVPARRAAFAVLAALCLIRPALLVRDYRADARFLTEVDDALDEIPRHGLLLAGIGTRRTAIPWSEYWAPPAEYLATRAVRNQVFVPSTFAVPGQHPLAVKSGYWTWLPMPDFTGPDDTPASLWDVRKICGEWAEAGHREPVFLLIVHPSAYSRDVFTDRQTVRSGERFQLVRPCSAP